MSASIVLKALASASAVVLPMLRMPMAEHALEGALLGGLDLLDGFGGVSSAEDAGDPSFFSSPVDTSASVATSSL